MKLKDILNTEKRFKKLNDLLDNGSIIKLCNDFLVIKKDKDLFKITSKNTNSNLLDAFLDKMKLRPLDYIENPNYFLMKNFLLNNNTYLYVNELVYFLNEKIRKTSYFKHYYSEYDRYYRISSKDWMILKHMEFLFLKTYPFQKYISNMHLMYILPGLKRFIKNTYNTTNKEVFLLLIQCDLCNDIYDIIDFVDVKENGLLFDKSFYKEIKHIKKDIVNINLCNHCYNIFLNKKQLMLKEAINY
jgi:hypothetical protein